MPKDQTRQRYAIMCCKMVFKFLVDHEFAHIIFGHLGLSNSMELNGISEKNYIPIDYLDSQSMEMDADSSATHQAMIDLYKITKQPNLQDTRREFVLISEKES